MQGFKYRISNKFPVEDQLDFCLGSLVILGFRTLQKEKANSNENGQILKKKR